MNSAHLHLMINHVPLIGTGFALLLLVVALWKRSEELKRVGLWFLVLMALLSVPAYLTGEPTEEIVEGISGISHALIEEHEDAAQWAFGGQLALGLLAVVGLIVARIRQTLPNGLAVALLLLALLVGGLMARTANLGGLIRHPEIRPRAMSRRRIGMPGSRILRPDRRPGASAQTTNASDCAASGHWTFDGTPSCRSTRIPVALSYALPYERTTGFGSTDFVQLLAFFAVWVRETADWAGSGKGKHQSPENPYR